MINFAARRGAQSRLFAGALLLLALLPALAAQAREPKWLSDVRAYRVQHEKQIVEQFEALLALPNVATNVGDIETNAGAIRRSLEARGFTTRLLAAAPGTPPSIFGELKSPGAKRTIVLYAHYDGQPVSQPDWRSDPWTPVMRADATSAEAIDWRAAPSLSPDWRIFARSASDDKAPIQALLSALDALKAKGRRPAVNVKIFYEGEEEQGSAHLGRILAAHKDLLAADLFVLGDGPRHPSGKMQVFFGARGAAGLELTVYGPLRALHSGHYGNWVPNPAATLAHLLASLRDEEGRVTVAGFHDEVRPLSPAERQALAALPDVESGLRRELGLGRTEGGERLADSISRPALNIRGIRVGNVGEQAANAIPTEAHASIDFRLVAGQRPETVRDRVNTHLSAQGWFVTDDVPDLATRLARPKIVRARWMLDYPAYRASMETEAARALVASIEAWAGERPVLVPTLGGSVPMALFAEHLDMPIIGVPIVNYDNNQHAANENLRLGNLWEGIEIYAALLTQLKW